MTEWDEDFHIHQPSGLAENVQLLQASQVSADSTKTYTYIYTSHMYWFTIYCLDLPARLVRMVTLVGSSSKAFS